jgi:hypothetical protein
MFKTFRIRLIFDFKIVFIKNFLKMAPTRVHFSPGFPPGAGLPAGAFFREFSGAPAGIVEPRYSSLTSLTRISLGQDYLGGIFRGFFGAPAVIRATLEQIPFREILLLEEIPGKSAH